MSTWILFIAAIVSASPGGAALRLVLSDAAGNRKGARRQITLTATSARATATRGRG